MSDHYEGETWTLSARRYSWLDRASKLLGVALIGTGLHLDGGTATALAIAALGIVFGLLTVFIDRQ